MTSCGECLRLSSYLPVVMLLFLAVLQSSHSAESDYLMDAGRTPPSAVSENTFRHIMQLVSLGTGLRVPPPLGLRYREKALKRARLSKPSRRQPDYFVMGSEFLGKRSSQVDEDYDKRMGSEFLGKRMGSEFLGKRMGSEFLGKRLGSEFIGKRMGSEFLGKRMGSEFLGKRMGSEFLGKKMDSEFLDKGYNDERDHSSEFSPDKRMGSEFLGKREDEYTNTDLQNSLSMEHPDSSSNQSLVFSENKRMGSEFLGRKRREVKPSELQHSEA